MTNADLDQTYRTVRARTKALVGPLGAEDCCVQSMPDASPVKWHLGHTTWFFETFILEKWEPGFKPFDPAFRVLFNSYYNSVGDKHPRPQRGLLTRPALEQVFDYRANVDLRIGALIDTNPQNAGTGALVELGIHHEQQHQELILTDIKHLFSRSPLLPAYTRRTSHDTQALPMTWLDFTGGLIDIGHAGPGFAYDNETPRHPVYLRAYRLASRLVTNAEYAAFIDAGGYANPLYWLAEGWDWRMAQGRDHPVYWQRGESGWQEFTLSGLIRLDSSQPVLHVSCYEADAYARWADARLPTEAEWEHAAANVPIGGNFAENNVFHCLATTNPGLTQLFGDAWEWTQSSYSAYPGFHPQPGAVGEYNGKFMVNQYVLRGGSCATPASHIRATYRNFFPASTTWQFSGIRLAQDG